MMSVSSGTGRSVSTSSVRSRSMSSDPYRYGTLTSGPEPRVAEPVAAPGPNAQPAGDGGGHLARRPRVVAVRLARPRRGGAARPTSVVAIHRCRPRRQRRPIGAGPAIRRHRRRRARARRPPAASYSSGRSASCLGRRRNGRIRVPGDARPGPGSHIGLGRSRRGDPGRRPPGPQHEVVLPQLPDDVLRASGRSSRPASPGPRAPPARRRAPAPGDRRRRHPPTAELGQRPGHRHDVDRPPHAAPLAHVGMLPRGAGDGDGVGDELGVVASPCAGPRSARPRPPSGSRPPGGTGGRRSWR